MRRAGAPQTKPRLQRRATSPNAHTLELPNKATGGGVPGSGNGRVPVPWPAVARTGG